MIPRGPRIPMRQMNPYQYGPRMFQPMPRQFTGRGGGGGGILSKLFSNKNGMAMNRAIGGHAMPKSSGGILANLLNPENASGMFSNIQKVMNVANQVGPMVQQYGPMVRNLPTLIKLYKEINSDDDNTESDVQSIEEEIDIPTVEEEEFVFNSKDKSSKPRLYI